MPMMRGGANDGSHDQHAGICDIIYKCMGYSWKAMGKCSPIKYFIT